MIEQGIPALFASVAPASPLFKPEDTGYPVISYRLLSRLEGATHDGPDGLVRYHYQFTIHAATNAESETMRGQVISTLRAVNNNLIGGVLVNYVEITNAITIGYIFEAWQSSVDATFNAKE